jgi:hypothetical protein
VAPNAAPAAIGVERSEISTPIRKRVYQMHPERRSDFNLPMAVARNHRTL